MQQGQNRGVTAALELAAKIKNKPRVWLYFNVQVNLRNMFQIPGIIFPNRNARVVEHGQPLVIPLHVQSKWIYPESSPGSYRSLNPAGPCTLLQSWVVDLKPPSTKYLTYLGDLNGPSEIFPPFFIHQGIGCHRIWVELPLYEPNFFQI